MLNTSAHGEPIADAGATSPEDPVMVELANMTASDESRFQLRSPVEIAYVLRGLVRAGALVRIQSDTDSSDFLLTSLLSVDAEAESFTFEASGSEPVNRRIARAQCLSYFTEQDKVRVQFRSGPAQQVMVDRGEAFRVAFPEYLLRLQRREYFRLAAPMATPAPCTIPNVPDAGGAAIEARLQDISLGGVGLSLGPEGPGLTAGESYPHCRIVLPDIGNVITTLAVRHAFVVTLLNGKTTRRYGCQFVRPSAAALALVQRYILKLERSRRAME